MHWNATLLRRKSSEQSFSRFALYVLQSDCNYHHSKGEILKWDYSNEICGVVLWADHFSSWKVLRGQIKDVLVNKFWP